MTVADATPTGRHSAAEPTGHMVAEPTGDMVAEPTAHMVAEPAGEMTAAPVANAGLGRTARGLATATLISLALRIVGVLIGIITTSLLARYLEPGGYGTLSLAMTLGTAAAQIADLGTATAVASRIARGEEQAARVMGTGLAIRSTVALVATAVLITGAFGGLFGGSSSIISIIAIATPLSAASVLTAGAIARFRPETSAVLALLQGAAWLVAVFSVVRSHGPVEALAWCFIGVVLLQTTVGVVMNRRIVPVGRPSLIEAKSIFALSWPLAVSSLAVTAYYRLDSVILFNTRGADELGFYAAAYKLLDVAQLAPGVLVAPLLPLVAASAGASLRRREVILSLASRASVVVGVGCGLMMMLLAGPLVRILFGAAYRPAVRPLAFLALAFVGVTLGWLGTTVNTALGRVRALAALTVIVAAVSLLAQWWACPRWGAAGAAAVTAVTELSVGVGSCLLAGRAMGARFPRRQLGLVVLTGAAVVGAAYLLPLSPYLETALGAVVFTAVVLLGRVIDVEDVRRVLSRRVL